MLRIFQMLPVNVNNGNIYNNITDSLFQAEERLAMVEEQSKMEAERQKLKREQEKQTREEQRKILNKGKIRPKLAFSLKSVSGT